MNIVVKKLIIENLDDNQDYSCLYDNRKELVSLTKKGISGYTSSGNWIYEEFERNPSLYDKIHEIYFNQVLYKEDTYRIGEVNSELNDILALTSDVGNKILENLNNSDPILDVKIGSTVLDSNLGTGIVVVTDEVFDSRKIIKVKFINEPDDELEIFDTYGRHWFKLYDDEPGEWSKYISLGLRNK